LPKLTEDKKTLFIDLDETLIHCLDNSECQPDFRLKISIEGVAVDLDITIRPYALTFLKKISKKWEVIVFTASHKDYADAILNEIDPDGAIFHHRLYRQHCIYTDELYVKDLSRVNRDLSKVVLVDNAAYSYCLQLANGIPILPYYDGKDFELSALEGYLARLEKLNDVRVTNYQYFKLDQYS
jgi:CTD small phosphatase-like protein 2